MSKQDKYALLVIIGAAAYFVGIKVIFWLI